MVKNWVRLATDKCKDYIVKAVEADSSITVTNDVMFSSSALDTTGFLLQVGSFWKHLEWPVASVAYGYAIFIVEAIGKCALFYVGEVFKKLSHEDMFDEKGQFRATEKVVTISFLRLACTIKILVLITLSVSPTNSIRNFCILIYCAKCRSVSPSITCNTSDKKFLRWR